MNQTAGEEERYEPVEEPRPTPGAEPGPEVGVGPEPVEAPPALDADKRLSILLFTAREKLAQRYNLRCKANRMLLLLALVSALSAVFCPYYMLEVAVRPSSFWTKLYFTGLALAPFVISIIYYFWTTFVQIFLRGLPNLESVLDSSDYEDFARDVDLDMLTDDMSMLSLIQNLFAVDVGFSLSRFFVLAALVLLPMLVQAGLSVAVVYMLISPPAGMLKITGAAGLVVVYLVFFVFTAIKGAYLYVSLKRCAD